MFLSPKEKESRFRAVRGDIRLSHNCLQSLTEVLRETKLERAAIGIDMVENPPSPQNQSEIMPGMVFIVHPWPTFDGGSLLWGETYLITEKGNLRLNKVGDQLVVL